MFRDPDQGFLLEEALGVPALASGPYGCYVSAGNRLGRRPNLLDDLITTRFSVARCPSCQRDVLLHFVSSDDGLLSACVHCDTPIANASTGGAYSAPISSLEEPGSGVRSVTSEALRSLGYDLGDEPKGTKQGCGGCCSKTGKKSDSSAQRGAP